MLTRKRVQVQVDSMVIGRHGTNSDSFAPGAVRRVRMKDFVVYSDVEFVLGNSLNLVIGPNGTGKSTLIAALCLGLCGKPENLGARKMTDYIKQGCSAATVEIELEAAPSESRNPVITRTISSSGSSSWTLNGKRALLKEVQSVIRRFRIQVDNLCQFLPQEKVAEFAQESARERLRSTERAIGDRSMLEKHDQLIKLSSELDAQSKSRFSDQDELAKLKAQHAEDQELVKKINDVEEIKEDLKLLEDSQQCCKLTALKARRLELSNALNECRRQIEEAKRRSGPVAPLLERATERQQVAQEAGNKAREERTKLASANEASAKKLERRTQKVAELRIKIGDLQQEEESLERELAKSRQKLEKLQQRKQQMEETIPDPDERDRIIADLKSNKERQRRLQGQIDEKKEQISHSKRQKIRADRDLEIQKEKLKDLESVDGIRRGIIEQLRPNGEEIVKAVRFVRQNHQLFKHKVFEPPLFNLNVKDKDCLRQVGATISTAAMTTFTCLSLDDYRAFTENVLDKLGLNVNVVEYSGSGYSKPSDHRLPHRRDQLQALGFDGYVIDLLEGPDPVLNMLCLNGRALVPFKKGLLNENQRTQLSESGLKGLFVDHQSRVEFLMSKGQEMYSSTQLISETPRWLRVFDKGSDQARILEARQKRDELLEEHREIMESIDVMKEEQAEWESRLQDLVQEEKDLKLERQRHEDYDKKLEAITEAISTLEEQIAEREENPCDFRQQRLDLEVELNVAAEKLIQLKHGLVKLLCEQRENELQIITLDMEYQVFSSEVKEYGTMVRTVLIHLERQEQNIKAEGKGVVAAIRSLEREIKSRGFSEERMAELQNIADQMSLGEVEDEIIKVNAKLELSQSIRNADHILEKFRKLEEKIRRLETAVETSDASGRELEATIKALAAEWELDLDRLIGGVSCRFSEAFQAIGCEGAVVLRKHPHLYDQWHLDIRVSFRKDAPLQILDSHRQSGGERSVSTILYLLSLQELAKAPFRVVDEINQGMDHDNERMVHKRMVEIACQENTSQYFLVTPKLLRDLPYDPRMKVCCIYSGDLIADMGSKKLTTADVSKNLKRLRDEEEDGTE
jgi:chromosome segregation ATPase